MLKAVLTVTGRNIMLFKVETTTSDVDRTFGAYLSFKKYTALGKRSGRRLSNSSVSVSVIFEYYFIK